MAPPPGPFLQATLEPAAAAQAGGSALLLLEVTLFACLDASAPPTPDCEVAILRQLLDQLLRDEAVLAEWQDAGGSRWA